MEVASAVRVPSPDPEFVRPAHFEAPLKRKTPSYSRSPSPPSHRAQPPTINGNSSHNAGLGQADERERMLQERFKPRQAPEPSKPLTEEDKQESARAEYRKLQNARSGGTYIPPAKLRALQAQITDRSSQEFQRMSWEALKKSINGLINKVNVANIKFIVPELFNENLVRGRGLFCRSIMKAQSSSLPFTPIFAAMAAIVNTKLPQVGELLVKRLVSQFKKAYRRNDKAVLKSATTFIAQLCNQQVIHELMAAHMLQSLLSKPTDDSVEIAVDLMREIGQHLEEFSGPIAMLVYDQFRNILHEADIEKRTQYMIEVLFQVRKDKYKDNPAIKDELDLVEEEDQITHQPPSLDDAIDTQDSLNIFKFDAEFEEHEEAYQKLKAEILGENEESGDEDDSDASSEDNEEAQKEREMEIKDQSNTDLTNLRRTIYLTINSSADFEECCHKLMKVNLPHGKESELPSMIIETCSQRPTYEKFYGLTGERFARLNRMWTELFSEQFVIKYETIHRYETNKLRNIARFFGHLLSTDAIPWHVLGAVHLNEEETTSSSRIFIKILFQELSEAMGMKKLQERLKDDLLQPSFEGIFPRDNPRNTRFSINYFTSIGMGPVTEGMREHLNNLPKAPLPTLPAAAKSPARSESVSSYSSYSSYTGSSYTGSRSRSRSRTPPRRNTAGEDERGRRRISPSRSPSPPRRRDAPKGRGRSPSRSRTPPRRGDARSSPRRARSPPRTNGAAKEKGRKRSLTLSVSRSPPPASSRRRRRSSVSRSPPPKKGVRGRGRTRSLTGSSRSYSSSRSRSPPRRGTRGARSPPGREPPPPRATDTRAARLSPVRKPASATPVTNATKRGRRNTSSPSMSRSRSGSKSRSRSPFRPGARNGRDGRNGPGGKHGGGAGGDDRDVKKQRVVSPEVKREPKREEVKKERSLSPYSKRVALTRGR